MSGPRNPTLDEQREALTHLLIDNMDVNIRPVFDAADGMKADLLGRGWTPQAAELLAGTWLASMLAKVGAA